MLDVIIGAADGDDDDNDEYDSDNNDDGKDDGNTDYDYDDNSDCDDHDDDDDDDDDKVTFIPHTSGQIPQIVKILRKRSASGVSFCSILLMLEASSATVAYAILKGFPVR